VDLWRPQAWLRPRLAEGHEGAARPTRAGATGERTVERDRNHDRRIEDRRAKSRARERPRKITEQMGGKSKRQRRQRRGAAKEHGDGDATG
jgi:hypothetical protein